MAIAVDNNCYAVMWSYGEICVHCNCCGRMSDNKKLVLLSQLNYHQSLLAEALNFDYFADRKKYPKLRHIQGKNVLKNITYQRKIIKTLYNELSKVSD